MESRTHSTEKMIWILLFFAFTACVISTLLQGAMVYKNVCSVLDAEYGVHTGLNYIQSRVRSSDCEGGVTIGRFDGCNALYCFEDCDDGQYATVIYCYEGTLRELYYEVGAEFTADSGEVLLQMDEVAFDYAGSNLIRIICSSGGVSGSFFISVRSHGGAL